MRSEVIQCRTIMWGQEVAARPGFEPGLTAPKADVLPLHHRAMQEAGHSGESRVSLLLF